MHKLFIKSIKLHFSLLILQIFELFSIVDVYLQVMQLSILFESQSSQL